MRAPAILGQPLSTREAQILVGIAAGRTSVEIGRLLFVSVDTVKTHTQRVFRKLGARTRGHAVALGYEQGLLRPGDSGGRSGATP